MESQKIDLSNYTILKDMWINFFDENEARDTEKCLEAIKDNLKWRTAENDVEAFKMSTIWNSLMFIAVWYDKEKIINDLSIYPTLNNNKETFLRFLNNRDNKMRGSELI